MFKCQLTGKLVPKGISPKRIVVEARKKRYKNIVDKKEVLSEGWEVVREISVDPRVTDIKPEFKWVDDGNKAQ